MIIPQNTIDSIALEVVNAARCGQLSDVIKKIRKIIKEEDSDVKEAMFVSEKLLELQKLLIWETEEGKENIRLENEYLCYHPDELD